MTAVSALTPCPVCGTSNVTPIAQRDDKTGEPLNVVQCAGCGLGRIDPMPSIESLQQWYKERYREDYKAATAPRLTHVLRAGRLALQRWNWLTRQQGFVSPSRSLDIGASSGEFVYLLKSRAIAAQGLEPHHGYSAHAREHLGLDIMTGTLHERLDEFPRGCFDLISLFHVLEHLPDPVQSLKRIREHLSDQGRVYLEVPDMAAMCSPANAFFRAHTLYFTAQSLMQTAQAAGFKVLADNFAEHDNLRVVLSPADSAAAGASFSCDHALDRGKALRTWPRYLRQRISEGYLWQRLRHRRDEKQQAARYLDGRHLLQALYGGTGDTTAIDSQPPT